MTKHQVLKQYFGYDTFRPLQAEIIDCVLAKQDSLVLMPTGGGKSVCFQVPAMIFEGITVVISPLIALMQDQVRNLKAIGIPAEYINSSLGGSEQSLIEQRCKAGQIKLLYISPEKLFSGGFMSFLKSLNISLFAIDESHCISFWGHDFRPEYQQLGILKKEFAAVPVIALTATADKVTRRDILAQMGIPEENVFISSFDRPNLSLTVLPGRNRTKIIADFINKRPQQPGIIYCLARNTTESVADSLRKMGIKAKHYHAKMDYEYRKQVQEEFIKDEIQVIVATIAFGMGIDKPNVRWIIHYNLPNNVESFYQEIGRAGRDGLKSDTLLFYSFADVISRQRMLEDSELSPEMRELQEAKLDRMKQYAEAEICRRRILLSYFNETVTQDCGNCDVCRNPPKRFDGTVIAQKALSGIARTGEQVAMGMLIDILRGSLNKSIVGKGYEKLKTFGVGKDIRGEEWADYLIQMLNSGVIDIAHDEKHSFKLNETSWQVLKQNRAVHLVNFVPYEARKARQAEEFVPEKSKKQVLSEKMFDALRQLRKQVADQQDVPAFVVFSDTTLKDMAEKMPATIAQMSRVSGVGDAKLKQYGQIFVNEIVKFIRENTETGKTRVVKGFTYIETLEMFREGLSVVEIAHHKGVTPQTIVGHLVKLAEEGETFEWQRAIPTADYKAIRQAAQKLGINKGDALKPLFEALNERFDYNILRLAMWVE